MPVYEIEFHCIGAKTQMLAKGVHGGWHRKGAAALVAPIMRLDR